MCTALCILHTQYHVLYIFSNSQNNIVRQMEFSFYRLGNCSSESLRNYGSDGRICLQCRRPGFNPGQEDPLEKGMATHSSILAWKLPWTEDKRSLVGYSPWGHKESDTTEWLTLALSQSHS